MLEPCCRHTPLAGLLYLGSMRAFVTVHAHWTPTGVQLQPSHRRQNHAKTGPVALPAAAGARKRRCSRQLCVQARRADREDYDTDYVQFDDEEDWEQRGTTIKPGVGPIFSTAMRGLTAVSERLADVALQFAPADASPGAVRVAVNVGLVLLALSFVKSLLSFFLTLGTIVLGAYVAVRVFGIDVPGVSGPLGGGTIGGSSTPNRPKQQQQQKRRLNPRSKQSEFQGLLGSGSGEDEDGLLDVWFERKGGSSSSSSSRGGARRDAGKPRR